MSPDTTKTSAWTELRSRALLIAAPLVAMWAIVIVNSLFLGDSLNCRGIRPREMGGLTGILWAPFLHGGFGHLIANTVPFAALGALIALRGTWRFVLAFATAALIGGLGTWVIGGANTIHIGASGVVFGFLGFLLFTGIFERSFAGIVIAVVVAVLYGGLIFGVLPGRPGISWEGHLFGFLGGVAAARIGANRTETAPSD